MGPTWVHVEEAWVPQQVAMVDLQCAHIDSEDEREKVQLHCLVKLHACKAKGSKA